MKRAIILHGMPSDTEYHNTERESQSNSHWLPWLQQQLCARDILAQTPEMPVPYVPSYDAWYDEFKHCASDEETILVGHSAGAGFLLRWLSENSSARVGKVVLVAPWLDLEGDYDDLFDFTLTRGLVDQAKHGIDLLCSTNDDTPMQTTLAHIRNSVDNIVYHEFIDYGHFTLHSMKTREFPELRDICLS